MRIKRKNFRFIRQLFTPFVIGEKCIATCITVLIKKIAKVFSASIVSSINASNCLYDGKERGHCNACQRWRLSNTWKLHTLPQLDDLSVTEHFLERLTEFLLFRFVSFHQSCEHFSSCGITWPTSSFSFSLSLFAVTISPPKFSTLVARLKAAFPLLRVPPRETFIGPREILLKSSAWKSCLHCVPIVWDGHRSWILWCCGRIHKSPL